MTIQDRSDDRGTALRLGLWLSDGGAARDSRSVADDVGPVASATRHPSLEELEHTPCGPQALPCPRTRSLLMLVRW